jgi:hypothetical protein
MKNILMVAAGWMGMAVPAILNGTCRVRGYGPVMRDFSIPLDAVFW